MGRQEKYKHKKFSLPFGLLSPALCTLCLHFILVACDIYFHIFKNVL